MNQRADFILTLSCRDRPGIVHAVAARLYEAGCNIIDSQQFGDLPAADDAQCLHATGLFFMRVHFAAPAPIAKLEALQALFEPARERFEMELALHEAARKPRLLLMVSREGHCLNDLLFRSQSGQLHAEVAAIASNHPDFGALATNYGIAFHHLPLAAGALPEAKLAQEQALQRIIEAERIDLVVLARYMQILSPAFCAYLKGRAINIHHSFLPSFKGARPYLQAHDRGVKLIGATAHYVTADLDEGPIIEQDVARVDHSLSPEDFAAVGRDVESVVLARAVGWHVEHRVLMNGPKTVVFR
ncbi:MAG: formyltetrahydrofolate deformylase [Rhizobacter sp.]|nr:formyltetrahydrofolate deformylase [Rhizobacter sp.]